MATELKSHSEYTVGWICALSKEQTAATAMLDQRHADLDKPPNDHNIYTLGSIGEHNIVIACLPKGKLGTSSAATVATQMVNTFPSIKVGLMVGIGGGIPPQVRLGDVVVSTPIGEYPGVVQWDFGKTENDGKFKRTSALNNPPTALLTALTKLETDHEMSGSKMRQYLDDVAEKWPKLAPKYTSSGTLRDPLSESAIDEGQREPREASIHYGLIASGNRVIKDSKFRDSLNDGLGGHVFCVEMEAAGLMDNFPCIVIRGICDYADSQKNKDWQEYAAMVAAAYAKELLGYVQPAEVLAERPARDLLHNINLKVEKIDSRLGEDKCFKVLNWLSPMDYVAQHDDIKERRQPGTGQWLLGSEEYQTWLGTRGETLFCPGIPGAGKTIMASIIIDDLLTMATKDARIGIAYIYCDFKRNDKQKAKYLLRGLLRQLAQKNLSLPGCVKDLYDQEMKHGVQPSVADIARALASVSIQYSQVFIIVDALDECQTADGCRSELLSQIFSLQASTKANFLATSRKFPHIEQIFKECLIREISANKGDVCKYLDGHMTDLPEFVTKDLEKDIKRDISQAIEGMFLLAGLYLNLLKNKTSRREIINTLKMFKERNRQESGEVLHKAYEDVIERINGQETDPKKLAWKVLAWITCAKRPLTTAELRYALAIKTGDTELDRDDIREIGMIRSVCAGLVIVNEESDIVRLVHFTAQEYFEQMQEKSFADEKAALVTTCITCLSFKAFEGSSYDERRGLSNSRKSSDSWGSNPFYDYAARYWGYHARETTIKDATIIDFLRNDSKVEAASRVMMTPEGNYSYIYYEPRYGRGIHVAAWFGLSEAITKLLKGGCSPDTNDSNGLTPSAWAAERGHGGVVKLLLAKGCIDLNLRGHSGYGYWETSASSYGWNPPSERLLTDDWCFNRCAATPLWYAARNGHTEIMRTLLADQRAIPNFVDDTFGTTPLWCASGNNHGLIVNLLLENEKVDPNTEDINGITPLAIATWRGHTTIVNLLLAKQNVNPCLKDKEGQTSLMLAVCRKRYDIVKSLLSKDQDVGLNSMNKGRLTPLGIAISTNDEEMARLLLADKRIDVNIYCRTSAFGMTPVLLRASFEEQENMVKLILAAEGVDPNCKDDHGRTPLRIAVDMGYKAVVECLLAADNIDLDAKCNRGRTPLLQATILGKDVVFRTLLDAGARPDARDNMGRTALHYAVREEPSEFFQLLLADERVDLNAKDHYGSTPLSIAVCNGFKESVARLLDTQKVDVNPKDNFGRALFWWAIRKGYDPISKLLLDHAKREDVPISDIDVHERPLGKIRLHDLTCCVCMQYTPVRGIAASCNDCMIRSWCTQDTTNICTDCFNAGARCLKEDHDLELWNRRFSITDLYSDLDFPMES